LLAGAWLYDFIDKLVSCLVFGPPCIYTKVLLGRSISNVDDVCPIIMQLRIV